EDGLPGIAQGGGNQGPNPETGPGAGPPRAGARSPGNPTTSGGSARPSGHDLGDACPGTFGAAVTRCGTLGATSVPTAPRESAGFMIGPAGLPRRITKAGAVSAAPAFFATSSCLRHSAPSITSLSRGSRSNDPADAQATGPLTG